jgi:pimeloyl-ACP methyl ester carboxylesterase
MSNTSLHRRALLASGLAAGLALPALASAQSSSSSPPQAGPFRFKARSGQEVDAERGFFEVPEDRSDPGSRRIRLSYVRFASTAAKPGAPIIYLAGGPGGTATGAAAGRRFPIFMALREAGDVIAFDQRGTGLSNAIPSRPAPAGPLPPFTRDGLTRHFRDEFQRGWQDWTKAGVAMHGYNTEQNADDVDDLRRHLGAETIDLWGISYGSHLGLSILNRHGDKVGRVALASLEGQDQTVKRPARIDAYLRRVDTLLAANPAVRAAVPDLPALMRRVHAKLEAAPARTTVTLGGAPVDIQVGGFAIQLLAGGLVANPETLVMLPGLYLALDAGQLSVLAPFLGEMAGQLSIGGMPEAMDLASGISAQRLVQVEREARTAVLGDALTFRCRNCWARFRASTWARPSGRRSASTIPPCWSPARWTAARRLRSRPRWRRSSGASLGSSSKTPDTTSTKPIPRCRTCSCGSSAARPWPIRGSAWRRRRSAWGERPLVHFGLLGRGRRQGRDPDAVFDQGLDLLGEASP